MDDQAELLGDDLDRAAIEIVGPRLLDLAGRIVALAAPGIGQNVVRRGQRIERFR